MNAFIAVLASGWPPFSHACLTSSVLKSLWIHGAGASSADAVNVANVSTPAMDRMLAINPSLDIDDDPWVAGTDFDGTAAATIQSPAPCWHRVLARSHGQRRCALRGELPRGSSQHGVTPSPRSREAGN